MPKQINSAGVGQRLVRLFSLKGRFQPVLDEVIVPVVSVDPEGVERRGAAGFVSQAAGGAGVYSLASLENPSGSGMLIRPTRFFNAGTTDTIYLFNDLTRVNLSGGLGAADNAWFTDARLPGSPVGVIRGTGSSNAPTAAASTLRVYSNAQIVPLEFNDIWILAPGDYLFFVYNTANQTMSVSIEWTEEPITSEGYNVG